MNNEHESKEDVRSRRGLSSEEIQNLSEMIRKGNEAESYQVLDELLGRKAWVRMMDHAMCHIHFKSDSPRAYAYWAWALRKIGESEGFVIVTKKSHDNCRYPSNVWLEHARLFYKDGDIRRARLALSASLDFAFKESPGKEFYPFELEWQLFRSTISGEGVES